MLQMRKREGERRKSGERKARHGCRLAPPAGRGRIASKDAIRVRGGLRALLCLRNLRCSTGMMVPDRAPHPDPLPVKHGERENSEPASLTLATASERNHARRNVTALSAASPPPASSGSPACFGIA